VPTLVAILAYGLTICRTVYFGDSGELSAAAAVLGVAHPPGYPLYLLLGRLLVALVPGEPALAVNLLSALAAAATAGVAALLARHLGARTPAAIAAGLLVIGSRTVWSQAAVAEVYTLHALLATGVLLALAADEQRPARDLRALLGAAYLLGLGLAHHLTIIHVSLAALLLLALRRRLPRSVILPATVLLGTALTLYRVLVVRSRLDPALDWGNPETLPRLADHVTARTYHFLVGKLYWPDALDRLREIAGHLVVALHPLFLLVIGCGIAALRTRLAWLAALTLLILALIVHAVAYGIPDIAGHLVPAAVLLAVIAGIGLDSLALGLERFTGRAGMIVLAAAVLPVLIHAAEADRSTHRSAREYGENLLASLPADATLIAEGDNQVFLLTYLTVAAGERPDVTIIDRSGNLLADFYGFRGEGGEPAGGSFHARRRQVEVERLGKWFAEDPARPIFTSGRTNLPGAGPFVQETSGLLVRLRPRAGSEPGSPPDSVVAGPHRPGSPDPWARLRTDAIRRDASGGDQATREIAARYWVRRGEAAFERGDRAAMTAAFDSATVLAPDSPDLASYIGAFQAQNGMIAMAIPFLERAVGRNPLSVRGWTNLGMALVKSGRREEGIAALEESLRIQPDQGPVLALLEQLRSGTR
jgi:tetratricopeptide (TPR) repeat protein